VSLSPRPKALWSHLPRCVRAASLTWLDANQPGAKARTSDPFFGYYTVDFERAGSLVGMLSINGYSGQVWYHTWHGSFIQTKDFGT
jgi:hypothetical protein